MSLSRMGVSLTWFFLSEVVLQMQNYAKSQAAFLRSMGALLSICRLKQPWFTI